MEPGARRIVKAEVVPPLDVGFSPCAPDDLELAWFTASLPARSGSAQTGFPWADVMPGDLPHLVAIDHAPFDATIVGRIPPRLAERLWDTLLGSGDGAARALFWVGWGVFRRDPSWPDGAVVNDNFESYFAYEASAPARRSMVDPTIGPSCTATYWWPSTHEWVVFTNIDSATTLIGFRDERARTQLLTAIPSATSVHPSDVQ